VIIINQRIENVKGKVVLFRPVYTGEGNICEVFFLEEEQLKKAYDQRNLFTVRQALARSYNLDISAQGRELQQKLKRKFPLPFYLPDGRIFVPLKMRKPLIIRDSTYGYVDLDYIKSVRKNDKDVRLYLTTGDRIDLYSTSASAYNSIELGRMIADYIDSKMEDEQEKILGALGILINKLYRIERILEKY
jgi:hypothetical protein